MEVYLPREIKLNIGEIFVVKGFINKEISCGARAIGFFGGRTVRGGGDIDMVVIKDGIQRGGITSREGIIHATYIPSDYSSDSIATFAKQIVSQAVWVWEK